MQVAAPVFCVLLVEDQPIILANLREELEDEHFSVLAAASAAEARELLDRHHKEIAAAFFDIDLGAGEDGYGLARYARQVRPDLPVVYTSGGARGGMKHERVSGSIFVSKPYHSSDVGALLRDLLSGSR